MLHFIQTGLSGSEITALRAYFSRQVDRFIRQRNRQNESNNNESNAENTNSSVDNASNSNTHNSQTSTNQSVSSQNNSTETLASERLRMEDEWMETQGPHSEFRLNLNANNPLLASRIFFRDLQNNRGESFGATGLSNGRIAATTTTGLGTDRDFLWGFILGFFVGFFMIFWVWMPTVPHKQKLGIMTGVCFQLVLNFLKNEDIVLDE